MLHQKSNYITTKQIDANHKKHIIIQNNSLHLKCINKINKRKNAKPINTFKFSTLYTKLPHEKLLDTLYKSVDFLFRGGTRDYIINKRQGCSSWSSFRFH